eukprot:4058151-Ditylum_brightwellii.AAC.1
MNHASRSAPSAGCRHTRGPYAEAGARRSVTPNMYLRQGDPFAVATQTGTCSPGELPDGASPPCGPAWT